MPSFRGCIDSGLRLGLQASVGITFSKILFKITHRQTSLRAYRRRSCLDQFTAIAESVINRVVESCPTKDVIL